MNNLKRIVKYLIPYKWLAVLNVSSNFLSAFFNVFSIILVVPMLEILFYGGTTNNMFSNESNDIKGKFFAWLGKSILSLSDGAQDPENGKMKALVVIAACIFTVFLLKNIFRYLGVFFMAQIRSSVVKDMRESIYKKMLGLPVFYFNEQRKGDLISRVTNDVQEVEVTVIRSLESLVKEPITILMLLGSLILMDYKLTLFILCILPPTGILISLIGKSLKKSAGKAQGKLGEIISNVEESLSGLKIIKAFAAEDFMFKKFSKKGEQYQKFLQSAYRKRDLASPLSEVLSIFTLSLVIWYGGSRVIESGENGVRDAAVFIDYIVAFAMLIGPLKSFTSAFYALKKGGAAEERISEFLMADNEIKASSNAKKLESFEKGIVLKDVVFGYDQDNPLFQNLNIEIKKGESIALVGQSGSGKTTLSNIIARFHDVSSGSVEVDGHNIKDINTRSLRKLMSLVSQESILFHGSVAENIAFGVENIDYDRVKEAAEIANAIEFIDKLEDGFETNIGEGGGKLSGGQKQRLCIARAIYMNPPVLILDEATSALDSASEKLVQDALGKVMEDRTSIVIAHRLSTIQNADRILVLDQGKIIEQGNHETLIAKNGAYKKLCDLQGFH